MVLNISFPANVQLQCTFLSGFTGSASCQVQYGTDSTYANLPYSAESNNTATIRGSMGVALRERLISVTMYYFAVSVIIGDITVVVQGSFTTPQYSKCMEIMKDPDPLQALTAIGILAPQQIVHLVTCRL